MVERGDRERHWPARDADTPLIAVPAVLADSNLVRRPSLRSSLGCGEEHYQERITFAVAIGPIFFVEATFPDK